MLLQLNKSYPLQMIHASKYPCILPQLHGFVHEWFGIVYGL